MALGLGAAGLVGSVLAFWAIIVVIITAATVFWIIEIVDVARREFSDPVVKIVWALVVIFFHFLGAAVYYFVGKSQGRLPV